MVVLFPVPFGLNWIQKYPMGEHIVSSTATQLHLKHITEYTLVGLEAPTHFIL